MAFEGLKRRLGIGGEKNTANLVKKIIDQIPVVEDVKEKEDGTLQLLLDCDRVEATRQAVILSTNSLLVGQKWELAPGENWRKKDSEENDSEE